jgi:hypothetical protein
MLDKAILSEGQQLLDIETKKRFDEPWSTKNIVEQGDALHVTIWAQNFDQLVYCSGLWFNVSCILSQHENHNGEEENQENKS